MDVSTLKGHVTVEFATEEAAQKLIMLLLHMNNVVGHTTICSSLTSQSRFCCEVHTVT
ncbi:hypothetical protein MKW92_037456 [Papaver armeniacum]|nr:hypothetical protein MKW92_037456 [Papaver armeniacum]